MATVNSESLQRDPGTGECMLDGMAVLMLPREEMARLQGAATGGVAEAAWQSAARRSAAEWCREEANRSPAEPATIVARYLDSLSRRGWGRFEVVYCRPEDCGAAVRVYNSPFAAAATHTEHSCRTFVAWLEGALNWACDDPDLVAIAEERQCAAAGAEACEFVVRPSVICDDD